LARWYIGIDWSDQEHAVWVGNEAGECMEQRVVQEAAEELSDFGRWLHERSNADIELWAAIEKPHGRIVEFLPDHNVVVYPVNPKSLDRARDRFRTSGSKSDRFDARVLAEFLRTDHGHLRPLRPSSPEAQELKLLTRDHRRLVKHQTRLVNQLVATLKEFYPLALGVFPDVSAARALDFLEAYPSPGATQQMDAADGEGFAREHRLGEAQRQKLEEALRQPRPRVPAHVERAKGRLVRALVAQLRVVVREVEEYTREVERFFVAMPLAEVACSLPGGKSGTTVPALWAELGDALDRWETFQHLQAEAGAIPVTQQSGKHEAVLFRFACNKHLRHAVTQFAFISLRLSEWARAYYRQQRARGHKHWHALRALAAKWLKIIFIIWRDRVMYDEERHLATIARQMFRQIA
jgi:transposase